MRYNPRTYSLVKRAIVEARIRKWFKRKRRKNPSPSKLLSMLLKPKKGIHIKLNRDERNEFVDLIRENYRTRKIISKYRKIYSRRPRTFYKRIFGFYPRETQAMRVVWGPFTIHFIFKRNDMIAFWRKVKWGPGSGGFYCVGNTDVKIKDLRGLVSFGREEKYPLETNDIIRHESVHAFEDFIKNKRPPSRKKSLMFFNIKSEMNAYLHNLKQTKKRKKREVNKWSRLGLGLEVKEEVNDYLSYDETLKRIQNVKTKIRKSKTKKAKRELKEKLSRLKQRLDAKRKKRRQYISLHIKTVNQARKALLFMPLEVLQTIIGETPYQRLHRKIPEAAKVYKKMKYEWYNE
jgi:hypothetical protein